MSKDKDADKLFTRLYQKLDTPLVNDSNFLLGIDLLRNDLKIELLKIITVLVEKTFLDLAKGDSKYSVSLKGKNILMDLVIRSTEIFLLKSYGIKIPIKPDNFYKSLYFNTVCKDANIIVILPFFCLLKSNSALFKETFTPIYNLPTLQIIEVLFDNLILTISNCVMRVIIHDFSLVSDVRQKWYKSNFLSVRNLERFKNNLAWQDRKKAYIGRPKNLYNGEYGVWVIRVDSIYYRNIYANRVVELLKLQDADLLVVNYIELQDFFLGRVDEAILVITKGTRYFLTSVVGQTIGLIWKGIIETLKK